MLMPLETTLADIIARRRQGQFPNEQAIFGLYGDVMPTEEVIARLKQEGMAYDRPETR